MAAKAVGAGWTYAKFAKNVPIIENDMPTDRIWVGKISEQ